MASPTTVLYTAHATATGGREGRAVQAQLGVDQQWRYLSIGILVIVIGALLAIMAFTVHHSGIIALSDAFDEVQLPKIELPGTPTVLVSALLVRNGHVQQAGAKVHHSGGMERPLVSLAKNVRRQLLGGTVVVSQKVMFVTFVIHGVDIWDHLHICAG